MPKAGYWVDDARTGSDLDDLCEVVKTTGTKSGNAYCRVEFGGWLPLVWTCVPPEREMLAPEDEEAKPYRYYPTKAAMLAGVKHPKLRTLAALPDDPAACKRNMADDSLGE